MIRGAALAVAALAALAGCGDNAAAPASPDAGPAPCLARFSGNFTETSTADACATVAAGSATLSLSIPSTTLGGPLSVTIDLGPVAAPGAYAPESVAAWSARAVAHVGSGACVYLAGSSAIPQGNFTLTLAGVDPATAAAHGTLALDQAVLAFPGTDCGAVDTEHTAITF